MLAVFLLSGCTNQVYEIDVKDDGTCTFSELIAVDVDIYNKMKEKEIDFGNFYKQDEQSNDQVKNVDVLFQETAELFASKGFAIEEVNDTVQVGFKARKDYKNIDDMNKDLKLLYQSGISSLAAEVEHDKNMFKDNYQTYGTIEFHKDPDFKLTDEEITKLLSDLNNPTVSSTLIVKTPGALRRHNGEIDGGKLKITSLYGEDPVNIDVLSGTTNSKVKMLFGFAGFIVFILIILFITKNFRKWTSRLKKD